MWRVKNACPRLTILSGYLESKVHGIRVAVFHATAAQALKAHESFATISRDLRHGAALKSSLRVDKKRMNVF
jgi:hypothetical protein